MKQERRGVVIRDNNLFLSGAGRISGEGRGVETNEIEFILRLGTVFIKIECRLLLHSFYCTG